MNKLLLASALLLAAFSSPAQSPTAQALSFNIFVRNGLNLINSETDGPVACGENLTVGGGYQVSNNNAGTFTVGGVPVTLVVGGRVFYSSGSLTVNQSGYVKIGNCTGSTTWYTDMSGAYSPMRITPTSDYNSSPRINMQVSSNTIGVSATTNPVCQSGLINFTSAFETFNTKSVCMAALADNAEITNSAGTIIPHTSLPSQIKINLHTGLNVLNVAGTDLNNVADFIYNNQPDSNHVLLINVNTSSSFTWTVGNSAGIGLPQCSYILYNFYNASTALTIGGYGAIQGTVFAPFSAVSKTTNMSNLEGQVIARSFVHGGGEVHYALFKPSIPGCTGATATTAAFSVNTSPQCLSGNSFVFTNGTTGTSPVTYLWTFGDGTTSTIVNPTKVYTATGTYAVKVVATGAGGTDSVTHNVVVSETPSSAFTVNTENQYLTGNHFVFTNTGSTSSNTYLWSFGDGSTSTAVNPDRTYTATGTYTVTNTVTRIGGCTRSSMHLVHVLSDSVGGSGGDGGLESESLGDLVSKRAFNKVKNNISSVIDYSTLPVFEKNNVAAKGTAAAGRLQNLTPGNLDNSTTARITTPADLTTITHAVDVFSVDYVKSNMPKAVVLGITTLKNVYNHTKSICDRFRGATLVSTELAEIKGYKFILFGMKQANGAMEYSITFTAGKSAGNNKFNLQSKWLISEYTGSDSVFNFQVWATDPSDAKKLAEGIITNLSGIMPLEQTDVNFVLPPAYIKAGRRKKEFLDITIRNTTTSTNGKIMFEERRNEFSGPDTLYIPFYLAPGDSNTFSIPVFDGYEYEGHLYLDDQLTDNVYMADGHWSVDFDPAYTTMNFYKPDNNFTRTYTDDEYPLYRNITVNAKSDDYINIYKYIAPGEERVDLSAYKSYKFFAKGSGTMEIRLIKKSIAKWDDQYKTEVTLDPVATGKHYTISFDDFTSENVAGPIKAHDITAVVYSWKLNGKSTDFNFFGDEQSFSPVAVPGTKVLTSKKMAVYPNPIQGRQFQCLFASDAERDLDLVVTNLTGDIVSTMPVHAKAGYNTITVDLPASLAGSVYIVKLGNKSVQYSINKISVIR